MMCKFNKTEQLIKIFKKCSISNFKEIKNFHPDGESMPNGISFQRGGYIKECIENKNSFILDECVHNKQYGLKKYRGGIIVFSTDVNVISDEKGFNKIKKKFENFWKTLINRIFVDKKIEKARRNFNNSNDENFYAYSIGHCFRGKYQSDNNKVYDENSITFEINGLSSESLLKVAELVAQYFEQETVLVKDLNKNKIYLADIEPMDDYGALEQVLKGLNVEC